MYSLYGSGQVLFLYTLWNFLVVKYFMVVEIIKIIYFTIDKILI